MDRKLILLFIGKRLITISPAMILVGLILLLSPLLGSAQQKNSKIEISLTSAGYGPTSVTLVEGTERLRFTSSAGWNLEIGYCLLKRMRFEGWVYYSYGRTSDRMIVKLSPDQYPQLRTSWDERLYEAFYRYHALGIHLDFPLNFHSKISLFLGNRFYPSGESSTGIADIDAVTHQPNLIFQAYTTTTFDYFCPEINLGYSLGLFKKWPSWSVMAMISIAPKKVIDGQYEFFPDYPDSSYGTFRLNQSYLGIGIKYRQVKRSK